MTIRITALTDPERSGSSHRLAWLASDDAGTPLGSAFLRLFTRVGQEHLADLELHVHPAERRHGVGTALLDAAVAAARADGRRSVVARVGAGSPGDGFLPARGFRPVLTLTYTRLPLADVDTAALTAIVEAPHPGYRLAWWTGTVPDGLAVTFAASRRAMDDMPMEDTDYGVVVWDVDRVREAARAVADRGDILDTVVALHDPPPDHAPTAPHDPPTHNSDSDGGAARSGGAGGEQGAVPQPTIVGFTELVIPGAGTGDAQHYGTAVLPEHRGYGLGLWIKAAAILRAREYHSEVGGLLTDTADSNAPMRRINAALGYVPTGVVNREYQLDL